MKKLFELLKSDKILKWGTVGSIALIVVAALLALIFYFSLPPIIPLFNQLPWGATRLGTRLEIFLPISIVFFFSVFNLFFLTKIYEKMPLLSRIVSATGFLISLLTLIFIIRTLLLIL